MKVKTKDLDCSVTFKEAFWIWGKIAIYSFGGPAGQIAVMHRILVEEKRWISENRFLHALNYCMILPGPEAQQLATYIGWILHKTAGGLVAGMLFVLPGFLSILGLSILYGAFQETSFVEALFFGLKASVLAVVLEAVIHIGRRALKNEIMVTLAGLAFVAIFFFNIAFPLIVLSAGFIGYIGGKIWEDKFYVLKENKKDGGVGHETQAVITDSMAAHTQPSWGRTFRVAVIWLLIWFAPLAILAITLGRHDVFVREGVFFSKAAVITFGGAYAVLAYIAQEAVNTFGWLNPGEMLDGLGMAETTPGPLIQVVQFVGFMGAYRHPGTLNPMVAGILGSILTTWVTFAPCFLWIFLGAPYIEHLRGNKSLSSALSGVTAAVVGVVLNLGVWFSIHTLFEQVNETHAFGMRLLIPAWQTIDFVSLSIAGGACIAMFQFKQGMIRTLGVSAVIGFIYFMIFRI